MNENNADPTAPDNSILPKTIWDQLLLNSPQFQNQLAMLDLSADALQTELTQFIKVVRSYTNTLKLFSRDSVAFGESILHFGATSIAPGPSSQQNDPLDQILDSSIESFSNGFTLVAQGLSTMASDIENGLLTPLQILIDTDICGARDQRKSLLANEKAFLKELKNYVSTSGQLAKRDREKLYQIENQLHQQRIQLRAERTATYQALSALQSKKRLEFLSRIIATVNCNVFFVQV